MAITNNIGHDDHQRDTPARNNLPIVAKYFQVWKDTGKRFSEVIHNEDPDEPLGCPLQIFTIPPTQLNDKRLDAFYYSPELKEARSKVIRLAKSGKIVLKKGVDFQLIPTLKKKEVKDSMGKIFKYFEITDVTVDGTIVTHREDYFENLPTRARLKVNKNDVIFAKNNSSRGTTILIPKWFSGNLVTTGFIGIRPADYKEALILWGIMESEFFRKQIYYLAITASQPEVREDIFKQEIFIPYPRTASQRNAMFEKAKLVDRARNELQKSLRETKQTIDSTLFK